MRSCYWAVFSREGVILAIATITFSFYHIMFRMREKSTMGEIFSTVGEKGVFGMEHVLLVWLVCLGISPFLSLKVHIYIYIYLFMCEKG